MLVPASSNSVFVRKEKPKLAGCVGLLILYLMSRDKQPMSAGALTTICINCSCLSEFRNCLQPKMPPKLAAGNIAALFVVT
jgi:hypothetical protein